MDPTHPTLSDPQCEIALLASLVRSDPETRVQMIMTLREEWFTSAERAITCRTLHDLVNESLAIDLTLLHESLKKHVPEATARTIVTTLGSAVPTASLWKKYAERVQGYHTRRKGIEACQQAIAAFQDAKTSPPVALEEAESALFSLHAQRLGKGMRPIADSLVRAMESIEESWANRGHVTGGLACGFTDIDRSNIKGLRPGHVWIIAAPPGGGKTVFMMKMAWNIATGTGDYREFTAERHPAQKIGIFTLEMDDVQLSERLLITLAQVEMNKMNRGNVTHKEKDDLLRAFGVAKASGIHFEFCPGVSIQELRVKARYAIMRYGLTALFIDYAQLITSNTKESRGNRTQEMMDVSKGLKLLAQECNVPVIVLAQPKQETWGQRAGLNALGETSQLAKDADLVGMLGFWQNLKPKDLGQGSEPDPEDNEPSPWDDDKTTPMNGPITSPDEPFAYAYFDIVKNRHGPNTNGKPPIKLKWERDYFDFISTNDRLFDSTGKTHQQ
jgi:replicative DNA helicase